MGQVFAASPCRTSSYEVFPWFFASLLCTVWGFWAGVFADVFWLRMSSKTSPQNFAKSFAPNFAKKTLPRTAPLKNASFAQKQLLCRDLLLRRAEASLQLCIVGPNELQRSGKQLCDHKGGWGWTGSPHRTPSAREWRNGCRSIRKRSHPSSCLSYWRVRDYYLIILQRTLSCNFFCD